MPFPDNYADCVRAIHVVEHFYPWQTLGVILEWVRVLKPGGELAVECPCLDKVIKLFEVPQIDPRYTFWALYGDPRHQREDMTHKWIFSTLSLSRLMMQAGLVNVRPEPPQFHFPVRDMRCVGVKPMPQSPIVLPQ